MAPPDLAGSHPTIPIAPVFAAPVPATPVPDAPAPLVPAPYPPISEVSGHSRWIRRATLTGLAVAVLGAASWSWFHVAGPANGSTRPKANIIASSATQAATSPSRTTPPSPAATRPGKRTSASPLPRARRTPTHAARSASDTPTGFRRLTSTAGLSVAIPRGWVVKPVKGTAESVAYDPAHPAAYVQFGGYRTAHASQLDRVHGYEQKMRATYTRLNLNPVDYGRADDAVDWQYIYRSDYQNGQARKQNGERHAWGLYWREGTSEYVLYANAPLDSWTHTRAIFQTMMRAATPQ
jgi:hypothetical protein